MTLTMAAYLAAGSGFVVGCLLAFISQPRYGAWLALPWGLFGALLAWLAFETFIMMDTVLAFGDRPSAGMALGLTLFLDVVALAAGAFGTWFQRSRYGR